MQFLLQTSDHCVELNTFGANSVGEDPCNSVTVHSAYGLKARHFSIILHQGPPRLEDYTEGLGTLVNGQPVSSHLLADGDTITAGSLSFVFTQQASEPATGKPLTKDPTQPHPSRAAMVPRPVTTGLTPKSSKSALPPAPPAPAAPKTSRRPTGPLPIPKPDPKTGKIQLNGLESASTSRWTEALNAVRRFLSGLRLTPAR
jgi:pSer/pThr/pTyr-binding forkhead associated (FHA) protein